jgi:two-component system response regulator YesN
MLRVMVVEDEPHIRSGLVAKIEQIGNPLLLVCGEAADGQEAADWLQNYHADVCLTDIQMPGQDGLSFIRESKPKYPWMQWIFVTSYEDFHYAEQAIKLGVGDYILKPVERGVLTTALEKAEQRIRAARTDRATQLLMAKLPLVQELLGKWQDMFLTRRAENYPLLIVDTLAVMEPWLDGDYVLFEALAAVWIDLVVKYVNVPFNPDVPTDDRVLGFDSDSGLLAREQGRFYFRLTAAMIMECSAQSLFDGMRNDNRVHNSRIVNEAIRFLEENYAERFTLDELAETIPISRSYLTVLFKQGTGKSIWNYLLDVRMRQAKSLLLIGELRIYELASAVGYESSEHFSKVFKEYFGLSPSEFKKVASQTAL